MKETMNSLINPQLLPTLSLSLLAWYESQKRDLPWRKTSDPYAIWISEVMLQQTQVKTVIPYYERFLQHFPGVEQLAEAGLDDVLAMWNGLGYYSRARRLWEGARYIREAWGGKMPGDYQALLLVPGIGKYTAGAIASIAFKQRVAAIDGNVLRVVSRLLAWEEPVETARSYRRFNDHLMVWQAVDQPGDFNQALMELGAIVCTPTKPDCSNCPLNPLCEGCLLGDALRYPVKKPKAPRQILTRLTFVLRKGKQIYLQKRASQGLLADLWEFPGVEFADGRECVLPGNSDELFEYYQKALFVRSFDPQVQVLLEQNLSLHGPVGYTFSHREWKLIWLVLDLPRSPDSSGAELNDGGNLCEAEAGYEPDNQHVQRIGDKSCWVALPDLGNFPLPVAFREIAAELCK